MTADFLALVVESPMKPNVCYWSPTGWAFLDESGKCTCRPCTETGEKVHPRIEYKWDRRIRRILKKQGIIDEVDE